MTQEKHHPRLLGLTSIWCALKHWLMLGGGTSSEETKKIDEHDEASCYENTLERARLLTAEEAYERAERRLMSIGMIRGDCRPLERRNILEDIFDGIRI